MILLLPAVKLKVWRRDDDHQDVADAAFDKIRTAILNRDRRICQGCGMRTRSSTTSESGYFHVHHMDDDHANNDAANLITLCPFCHDVFHLGNAGAQGRASAIWLPQVSQNNLNILFHAMFILMHRGFSDPQANEQDKDYASKASDLYAQIRSTVHKDELEPRLGAGMTDLRRIGEAMAWLGHNRPEAYAQRHRFLYGLRVVPDYDFYQSIVSYFSMVSNYKNHRIITADALEGHWRQWSQASA